MRFDANVARDLPWRFEPEVAKISLRTGETKTVYYKVANLSDRETSGQAAYNVTPGQAGAFFVKVACFCFEEKRLGPHETEEWPVVFYLDPALEREEAMRGVRRDHAFLHVLRHQGFHCGEDKRDGDRKAEGLTAPRDLTARQTRGLAGTAGR